MKKKVIVLSLGGSLILPDKVNQKYLKTFKKIIQAKSKKYKFVIVCGGGSLARRYITSLQDKPQKIQSTAGIAATRANAKFVSCFFNQDPTLKVPIKIKTIKKYIKKQDIILCGGLEYKPKQTSDGTAAEIAKYFKSPLINLTNISGLHTKNPKTHKDAKFIPKISWKEFNKMANKIKYQPGQHFVLDQSAAKKIMESKIKTYILGTNLNNLYNLLKNKKFKGTEISG